MERRQTRSDIPGEALQLYLTHLASKYGAEAVVVADDAGLVVCGSGDADLDVLAANTVAPLLPANDTAVHELCYADVTLRLSTLKGAPVPAAEVSPAIARILDLAS